MIGAWIFQCSKKHRWEGRACGESGLQTNVHGNMRVCVNNKKGCALVFALLGHRHLGLEWCHNLELVVTSKWVVLIKVIITSLIYSTIFMIIFLTWWMVDKTFSIFWITYG